MLAKATKRRTEKKALTGHNFPHQHSTSCVYWTSKLRRGTFWAGLETFHSLAAAFEGLRSLQPSTAAFEGCPLALLWTSLGPTSCFYSVGSLRRYPTFLLARPSTQCVTGMFALDSPRSTRRPNKWAPVRMLLRQLFHALCSGFTSPLQGNKVIIPNVVALVSWDPGEHHGQR